jgi:hypothetical protein
MIYNYYKSNFQHCQTIAKSKLRNRLQKWEKCSKIKNCVSQGQLGALPRDASLWCNPEERILSDV